MDRICTLVEGKMFPSDAVCIPKILVSVCLLRTAEFAWTWIIPPFQECPWFARSLFGLVSYGAC